MENRQIQVEYKNVSEKIEETGFLLGKFVYKGDIEVFYGAKVYHKGLDEYIDIKTFDELETRNQIEFRIREFNYKWTMQQLKKLDTILLDGLSVQKQFNWNNFKKHRNFEEPEINSEKEFFELGEPKEIEKLLELPEKPVNRYSNDEQPQLLDFLSKTTSLDFLFGKTNKIRKAEKKYKVAYEIWSTNKAEYNELLKEWNIKCSSIEELNEKIKLENHKNISEYDLCLQEIESNIEEKKNERLKRKEEFDKTKNIWNNHIDELEKQYPNGNLNSIIEYSKLILDYSNYPDFVLKNFEIDYNPTTKILVVEYSLPPIDSLPTLKEVKWIKYELKEYHISEIQAQKNFEKTMYNITLRTIYELFHTDEINALDAICFNGWVNSINKATGKRENNCILSIQVKKEEFSKIDLSFVDPKTCFKTFKGVSSSKLSAIASIQPIIQLNRKDKRFVESQNVTQNIDESTNLAAMDWEEFEHLIRELFEKEFSYNGGEVKVTQASRDGGVDAIAFDPDPIRGGKIVIQAKRYTNTVGVSAVRDLYGTVMNEGANKGILVTTSDYGPDSYEFAKGKPLTLLNGGNLLYLLEKHGHNAKIDIEEARRLMKV